MPFRYRLQKVLDFRIRKKEEQLLVVQKAQQAVLIAEENIRKNNEEIEATGQLALRHEAVGDQKFKDILGESTPQDTLSRVVLKDYKPNCLTYDVESGKGGVVVFSEIYYPGWTATVDGEQAKLGRVDYVLRALNVSPGEHEVVLTFKPSSIRKTETVAYVSYFVLLLAVALGLFFEWKRRKN